MTTRIDRRFAALKREGRAALVTFITAGGPDYATSLAVLQAPPAAGGPPGALGVSLPGSATSLAIPKAAPAAGAHLVELGMPFTDPMADGPAVQASSLRALKAGQTLRKTLDLVRAFRTGDGDTPIVLMGYYNPIYIYGVDRFLTEAVSARVDGLIVVDLPAEEDDELCLPAFWP